MNRTRRFPGGFRYVWIGILVYHTVLLPISAQTTRITLVSEDPYTVRYSLTARDMPAERVLDNIRQGLRSRITFTIRVLREVHGISRIFGDRPLAESRVYIEARLDPFSGRYVLTDNRGTVTRYEDSHSMMKAFFSLDDVSVPAVDEREAYVIGRSRLEITRLLEPLSLLMPFMSDLIVTTPWSRLRLPDKPDSGNDSGNEESTHR